MKLGNSQDNCITTESIDFCLFGQLVATLTSFFFKIQVFFKIKPFFHVRKTRTPLRTQFLPDSQRISARSIRESCKFNLPRNLRD